MAEGPRTNDAEMPSRISSPPGGTDRAVATRHLAKSRVSRVLRDFMRRRRRVRVSAGRTWGAASSRYGATFAMAARPGGGESAPRDSSFSHCETPYIVDSRTTANIMIGAPTPSSRHVRS
jgi:hypothetical protein